MKNIPVTLSFLLFPAALYLLLDPSVVDRIHRKMRSSRSSSNLPAEWLLLLCLSLLLLHHPAEADDYAVAPERESLLVAMGCFWCGEEAFEHYAPGVVEAVSGYAGGTTSNPTYKNHAAAGHFEVVLVEYDPTKTSYGVLLNYALRNIDPFDGGGQFCDRGSSYRPAIFYDDEEERLEAELVRADVLDANPTWDADDLAVPLLERPTFWKAEEYHQNYYIKKPGNYEYYKKACGRSNRLVDVWGQDVYDCYHDLESTCFDTVTNANGTDVKAQVNVKEVPEGKALPMPIFAIIILSFSLAAVALCAGGFLYAYCRKGKGTDTKGTSASKESDTLVSSNGTAANGPEQKP